MAPHQTIDARKVLNYPPEAYPQDALVSLTYWESRYGEDIPSYTYAANEAELITLCTYAQALQYLATLSVASGRLLKTDDGVFFDYEVCSGKTYAHCYEITLEQK